MEAQKHSGLGIASFIISIVAGISMFLIFVAAGVMEVSSPNGIDEKSAGAIVLGLFIIVAIGASLIALGIGIAGLLQKERKKIFAVLGTVFSTATLVCTIALLALGLAVS
jgi:hypothetical protein